MTAVARLDSVRVCVRAGLVCQCGFLGERLEGRQDLLALFNLSSSPSLFCFL